MARLSINPIAFGNDVATAMALKVYYDYSADDMLVYSEYYNNAGKLLNTSHIRVPKSTIPSSRENDINIELHIKVNNIEVNGSPLNNYGSFKHIVQPKKFIYELYEDYLEMHFVNQYGQNTRDYIYGTVPDSGSISGIILPTLNVIVTDDNNAVLDDNGEPIFVDDVSLLSTEAGEVFESEDGQNLFQLE